MVVGAAYWQSTSYQNWHTSWAGLQSMVHRKCTCSIAMACIGHMTCSLCNFGDEPSCRTGVFVSLRKQQMFDELNGIVLSCVYTRRRCILLGFSVQLDMTHDICKGIEIICSSPSLTSLVCASYCVYQLHCTHLNRT